MEDFFSFNPSLTKLLLQWQTAQAPGPGNKEISVVAFWCSHLCCGTMEDFF